MRVTFRHYSTALLALLALNLAAIWLHAPVLAAPTAVLILLFEASAVGTRLLPGRTLLQQHLGGLFILACWYAVAGSAVYAAADLSAPAVLTLWLATALGALAVARHSGPVAVFGRPPRLPTPPLIDVALVGLTLAALVAAAWLAVAGRTLEAIRSPWQAVPALFLALVAAAALGVLALLARGRTRGAIPLAVLLTFVSTSIALIVYGIGYGFDQFVHESAIRTILERGVIAPKTPYYIGQYALVTLVSRVTLLPFLPLTRLITPLGYALLLPLVCSWTAGNLLPKNPWRPAALAPLLLPFTAFIATTPTGLAYLFAAVAIGAAVVWRGGALPLAPAVAGTLAALAVHPLVGIPTAGALLLALPRHKDPARAALALRVAGVLLIVCGVPAAFFANAALGGELRPILADISHPLSLLRASLSGIWPAFAPTGQLLLDLPYLWRSALPLALVGGALLAWRSTTAAWRAALKPMLWTVGLLLVGYLALGVLRFPAAGDVGAAAFPFRARLLELAALFLLPAAGAGLVAAFDRISRHAAGRMAATFVLAALVAATVYISYPRIDRIEPSKGYAVSASTVAAVQWIERACTGSYVVLGNQTMAAAAIRESGFKAYYAGNFYYANESGAPLLYDYFLKMNAAPTRETARAAMNAVGVDEVFFAVHDYWKDAPRIVAAAKKTADDSFEIDGGKVMVFVYRR